MSRRRPPDRFSALIAAATPLFVRAGVRRVQMDEVARALGIAKGTTYLYVESKEALFDACLRAARHAPPQGLPWPTPPEEETLAFVREAARRAAALPAIQEGGPADRAAVTAVLEGLYAVVEEHGTTLKLVAGSAVDWPELGVVWYAETRDAVFTRLERWVAAGSASGALRAGLHPAATARLVAETATWFAVHRRWDPRPGPISDDDARETALRALHHCLLEDP